MNRAQAARRALLHARRVSLWSARLTMILVATTLVALVMLVGQRLHAPEWFREQLEERIERNLGGLSVEFGDVQFVLDRGWHPRLRLVDFRLGDAEGRTIVQLADARAGLALRALLKGQVQPQSVSLSGAQATLRRGRDGEVELSFGGAAAPAGQAESLPQLIRSLELNLARPELEALGSVDMDSLTLRYEDARQGRAWTLDGGVIRLDRDGADLRLSASFALLSGRDYASTVDMNYTSVIGETEAAFGVSVQDIPAEDIAAQSVALAWLGVLRAPISGALRGGIDAKGALAPLSATLQIGQGVIQPNDRTRPVPFDGARSYFTYRPDEQVLVFDELSVDSSWVSGTVEGRAFLNGVGNGTLTDMEAQFRVSGLMLDPEGQFAAPVELGETLLDLRLVPAPFRLTLGQLAVTDGGNSFVVSGDLAAEEQGWRLALDGRAERLTPERAVALWPLTLAPKPRKWVFENLAGGEITDADFAMRLAPGERPRVAADFDFDGTSIRFLKTMPPITNAKGHASLVGKRFVATATGGRIVAEEGGAVDVAGTSFIIPDVSIRKAAPGEVRMTGAGSATAVLSLLNRPPLRVLKGTPLPVDMAEGVVRANGTLKLPLKKGAQFDEMDLKARGDIAMARSAVLVPGHVVAAPVLAVDVDNDRVVISGGAKIDEVPVRARWRQPIGKGVPKKSRLVGEIELSPRLLETFAIGLPPGSVTGSGSGEFTLDFAPGRPPALSLHSALEGVRLSVPELGWSKPAPVAGRLDLNGVLGERTRVDRLRLEAPGLTATGTVLNRPEGGLDRAVLDSVRVGGWMDASVELVGRGDRAPDIRITGGTVDMRQAAFGSGGRGESGGETGPLQATLDRLQVTDTIALTDFSGQFETAGGLNGTFTGRLNGRTEVSGTVVPKDGRSAVQVKSKDAGGVFSAAGILDQGRGGDFTMTLVPVGEEGQFDGVIHVSNTRIKDAPAMAALLNAISVVGLLNELAGQGIPFATFDARFRIDPDRLTLYESSAEGASLGLSMDGVYDFNTGNLAMRGVVSPVYLLNSIGSVLTRKGEGLFGFNYTLTGPADDPKVQVNPLSGLTPGMFREIFRGAPPPTDAPATPKAPDKPATGTRGGER